MSADRFSLARLPNRLGPYRASPAEFRRLHTIYYDTEDYRLARWGCSLRYRVGEGWTLKLPAATATDGRTLARNEHTFEGDDWPIPARALDLVRAIVRGAPVDAVSELRTIRTKRAIRGTHDGVILADVVDDDVRVVDGPHVEKRFRQIEIERVDADDGRVLDRLADALRREGAGRPDPVPKNVHAMDDALVPELTVPKLCKTSSAGEVFTAAFTGALQQLIRLDNVIRRSDDAEAIHEIRTAVRRMRSYLRSFRPILQRSWAEDLRERLSWMNRLFARARNLDVLIEKLEGRAAQLEPADSAATASLLRRLRNERVQTYDHVRTGLRDRRYDELLETLVGAAHAPRLRPCAARSARAYGRKILRGTFKRLQNSCKAAGTPPGERDLHRIRIKSKHVRFAAEALAATGKRATDVACRAEALQDALGEYHDAIAAMHTLRLFANDAQVAYGAGLLVERSRADAQACRKEWRKRYRALVSRRR